MKINEGGIYSIIIILSIILGIIFSFKTKYYYVNFDNLSKIEITQEVFEKSKSNIEIKDNVIKERKFKGVGNVFLVGMLFLFGLIFVWGATGIKTIGKKNNNDL